MVISLGLAALVFIIYKHSLDFKYSGRWDYMIEGANGFLLKNMKYMQVAFLPIAIWFFFVAPKPIRGSFLLCIWMFILAAVSLLTTDVTRVITIISMPIVLISSIRLTEEYNIQFIKNKLLIISVIIAVVPVYSWSGLDFLLWPSLINNLCKWANHCF